MKVSDLMDVLRQRSIELWFEGDRLRYRAPRGALSPDLRSELAARRSEILNHLRTAAAAKQIICQLSFAQRSHWLMHQQMPQSWAYNIALSFRVEGAVDQLALRQALQALVDRHAILRTTYDVSDGALCQLVAGTGAPILECHTVPDMADAELFGRVQADFRRPFDLAECPPFRVSFYTRDPEHHVLLLTFHHIAVDASSMLIIVDELTRLYSEAVAGHPTGLARQEVHYVDYVRWQQDLLAGAEGELLWSHWSRQFPAPPTSLNLPIDYPRPPINCGEGASVPVNLSADLTARVRELSRQRGTTPFVVLLATFHVFLSHLSGGGDVVVGAPAMGRSNPQYLHVVGNFVNSLPIRARISHSMTFSDIVDQLRGTLLGALDAQEYPLSLLVQRLQPPREPGRSPLFDTFFMFQQFEEFSRHPELWSGDSPKDFGALRLAAYPIQQQEGAFDLTLELAEHHAGIFGSIKYRSDLFKEPTIRRFSEDYVTLALALICNPAKNLSDIMASVRATSSDIDDISLLISCLRERDIRLFLDGGRLRINAPRGALDDETKATITARRDEIITHLKEFAVSTDEGEPDPLRRIPRDGLIPASSAQQRLWFLNQVDPGQANYNIGGGLRFHGHLDTELMRQAILSLISRHEAFRTRIVENNGQPWLELLNTSRVGVDSVDLSTHPADRRDEEVRLLGESLLKTPFNMAQGALAAFLIIRLAPDDHVVLVAMHHVISDGWSLAIAHNEVCALYDALAAGRPANLAPPPIEYLDYAAWEVTQARAGHFEEQLAYWKHQLKGAPATLELPSDRPRPPVPSHRGGRLRRYFDGRLIASLEAYSREQNATLFMTLLAAWQVLMYRYSGQDDIVVGTPVANRDAPELERVIGCLVNNIPLRGRLDGNPRFPNFLAQLKQTTLAAFDHRTLPFDKLVQALNPERSVNHAPIFQVFFTLMSFPVQSLAPAGLTADFVELDSGASRFDLAIEMGPIATRQTCRRVRRALRIRQRSVRRFHDSAAA